MPAATRLLHRVAALAAVLLLSACGTLKLPGGSAPAPAAPAAPAAAAAPRELPPAVARIDPLAPGLPGLETLPPGTTPPPEPPQTGIASWYGRAFHGRRTASGERFDMHAMTAAHRTLPFDSRVLVRNPANGREVVVRINDRGPFKRGRIVDLSYAAAKLLEIHGIAPVELRPLRADEISASADDPR